MNTIFDCLHMFLGLERGHRLCTYATVRGLGVIQNAHSFVQWEGVSRLMYTYAPTLSLFRFLVASLSYSFLFYLQKFIYRNLHLSKKNCVRQEWLFFSDEINFCSHKTSFFSLNLFSPKNF